MIKEGRLRIHPTLAMIYDAMRVKIKKYSTGIPQPTLIGGAVLSIIDCDTPKDYDFVNWKPPHREQLIKNGFIFEGVTKTAFTYKKSNIIVQLLKTNAGDFDYTISQASFNPDYGDNYAGGKSTGRLTIDVNSYYSKTLEPLPECFNKKSRAWSSLARVPYYTEKGYKLPYSTYLSLLNVVAKRSPIHS